MLPFTNSAQELTYRRVMEYLSNSMFKDSMRVHRDMPRFDLLYQKSTLIEVDILPWEIHPWDNSELAIVRASSCITIGSHIAADLTQYLLTENRKMRFGAFQFDESGLTWFSHSILGGENMDLQELQTCILSVAAIATSYEDIIMEKFSFTNQKILAI